MRDISVEYVIPTSALSTAILQCVNILTCYVILISDLLVLSGVCISYCSCLSHFLFHV